jgi:hypothetical protein
MVGYPGKPSSIAIGIGRINIEKIGKFFKEEKPYLKFRGVTFFFHRQLEFKNLDFEKEI